MYKWIAKVSHRFFLYALLCLFISSLQVNRKTSICASSMDISSKTQWGVHLCWLTLDKGTEGCSSTVMKNLSSTKEVKIALLGGVITLPFSAFSIGRRCSSATVHKVTYFPASLFLQSSFLSFGNRLKKKNYTASVTCVGVLTDRPTLAKLMLKFILQPPYPLLPSCDSQQSTVSRRKAGWPLSPFNAKWDVVE